MQFVQTFEQILMLPVQFLNPDQIVVAPYQLLGRYCSLPLATANAPPPSHPDKVKMLAD